MWFQQQTKYSSSNLGRETILVVLNYRNMTVNLYVNKQLFATSNMQVQSFFTSLQKCFTISIPQVILLKRNRRTAHLQILLYDRYDFKYSCLNAVASAGPFATLQGGFVGYAQAQATANFLSDWWPPFFIGNSKLGHHGYRQRASTSHQECIYLSISLSSTSERRQTSEPLNGTRSSPWRPKQTLHQPACSAPLWNLSKQCSHQSNTTLHTTTSQQSVHPFAHPPIYQPPSPSKRAYKRSFDKAINICVYVCVDVQ